MAYKWTDNGRNYVTDVVTTNDGNDVLNTIIVGNGTSSPNENNTSLENELYRNDTSSPNVVIERASGFGEIKATIEISGGTEVPSDSEISELGLETSSGTLLYREVRSSPITVSSGETKIIEIRVMISDNEVTTDTVVTDVGRGFVADAILGLSTEELTTIAIGDATGDVFPEDTTLDSELYRETKSGADVTIEPTSSVGDIRLKITVTAGTESTDDIPANSEISEFGILTNNDTLLYHEKRESIVTLENNDRKTFDIPLTIVQ